MRICLFVVEGGGGTKSASERYGVFGRGDCTLLMALDRVGLGPVFLAPKRRFMMNTRSIVVMGFRGEMAVVNACVFAYRYKVMTLRLDRSVGRSRTAAADPSFLIFIVRLKAYLSMEQTGVRSKKLFLSQHRTSPLESYTSIE